MRKKNHFFDSLQILCKYFGKSGQVTFEDGYIYEERA